MLDEAVVRREFLSLLERYLASGASVYEYLEFEAGYWADADDLGSELRGQMSLLSLLAAEYEMELRPLSDFEEAAREIAAAARPRAVAAAAG